MEIILDTIDEEVSFGDSDDVEMMDIEEGEVVDEHVSGKTNDRNDKEVKPDSHCGNLQPAKNTSKRKKKKKKKKKYIPQSDGLDIDSFVVDACKRLRERKSYLVYTAVGVLGVSAIRELLKEVVAVQACGGKKTALGDRFRSGGDVLWNILKARDPNAYKGKWRKEGNLRNNLCDQVSNHLVLQVQSPVSRWLETMTEINTPAQEQSTQPSSGEKRVPVHDRIRVPVSYDDLPVEEPPKDQSS